MKKAVSFVLILLLMIQVLPFATFTASAATEYKSGDYYYTLYQGKATITAYVGMGGIMGAEFTLKIPSTLDGYPVTHIEGIRAQFTSVIIPDSVISIGDYAFANCGGDIYSIVIGNNVTRIGEYAFANCPGLQSITIPKSVTHIEEGAFWECKSLITINYKGTQADRNKMSIGKNNTELTNAQWYYAATTTTKKPTTTTTSSSKTSTTSSKTTTTSRKTTTTKRSTTTTLAPTSSKGNDVPTQQNDFLPWAVAISTVTLAVGFVLGVLIGKVRKK